MAKPLSIHVTYANNGNIFNCLKEEFLSQVTKHFDIDEDIDIYEITKEGKRRITVYDLKDFMRLEIMQATDPVPTMNRHNRAGPSKQLTPAEAQIIQKLKDNHSLNGMERKYLVKFITTSEINNLKRRRENGGYQDKTSVNKANKKVQIHIPVKDSFTQTDEQAPVVYEKNPELENRLEYNIKRVAAAEKIDKKKARLLMDQSYPDRRNFIMIHIPPVAVVKEKYPLLFTTDEVKNELDRIFYVGKCEEFLSNIDKYSPSILDATPDDDKMLIKTKRIIDSIRSAADKKYAQNVGALLLVSTLLNERREYLLLPDEEYDPGNFPHIVAAAELNAMFLNKATYEVKVEGKLLCKALDFKEAILCLMACFFIFNIRYPDPNFNTLVTFEKIFLEGNDTEDVTDEILQIIKYLKCKTGM